MSCPVDKYLAVLTHELTRYDMAQSRREAVRGRVNIYRLGLLLEAAGRVREDVGERSTSADDAARGTFRRSLETRFERGFPPVKRVIKQLDAGTCKIK